MASPLQISRRRAATPHAAHRHLVIAGAFLSCAVEVIRAWNPGCDGGLDERLCKLMWVDRIPDRDRAACAMIGVGPMLLVFGLPKIGQDVFERPADISRSRPTVIVL